MRVDDVPILQDWPTHWKEGSWNLMEPWHMAYVRAFCSLEVQQQQSVCGSEPLFTGLAFG